MATTCELSTDFEDSLNALYEMFLANIQESTRWGTRWDIVRDETFVLPTGESVRQVWGFSSAFARTDGMGGHVSFMLRFVEHKPKQTEIEVIVTSPYEQRREESAYYKRNHRVALRLLEFCVAPYEEIHPRVGVLKRFADPFLNTPAEGTTG